MLSRLYAGQQCRPTYSWISRRIIMNPRDSSYSRVLVFEFTPRPPPVVSSIQTEGYVYALIGAFVHY